MAIVPGARRRVFYFLGTFEKKETRKAELEGEVALRDLVSPTRQVSATAGALRWTRNETFFDNRKAGKSTPTIVT
jgi:hypothetical protein